LILSSTLSSITIASSWSKLGEAEDGDLMALLKPFPAESDADLGHQSESEFTKE